MVVRDHTCLLPACLQSVQVTHVTESALKAEKTLHKQVSISYKHVHVMLSFVLAEISC